MPNRLIRNTAILAKLEATYGTDSVPTGGANAILVTNLRLNPINANNVDRDIIRPYLGGSEQLVGTRYIDFSFDVEYVGSGTVATAPAWAPLVQACGCGQVLTATVRADYVPISDLSVTNTSITVYWYDDGVLHKATGVRGNVKPMMKVGERPMLSFEFQGLYSTATAAALPSTTLTGWKTPQVVADQFTGDLIFGGTHATATAPLLVGGTSFVSQGIELDYGNTVSFVPLLGQETVEITQRNVTGKVTLDLSAAQMVAQMAAVEGNTLTTIGVSHGTVANNKALIWLPSAQLINPQLTDLNGKRLVSFDIRAVPVSGNDEVRLVTSF